MNYYNEDTITEIRNKSDIVSIIGEFIPLKKRGRNFIALCPFHNEKTPSFVVSLEKQIYYCFGCSENGDIFSFLMKYNSMTFNESIEFLSNKLGINIEKNANFNQPVVKKNEKKINDIHIIHTFAARYFYKKLYSNIGINAIKYIKKRNIKLKTLKLFKIGYAPYNSDDLVKDLINLHYTEKDLLDSGIFGKNNKNKLYLKFYNRLIFPIENTKGKIIAFGGRSLKKEEEPKYLNSQETLIFKKKNNLFALNNSLNEIRKLNQAILMEGYMDVITAWQNGVKNIVASLGTSFTEEQSRLISRYCSEVIIAYDNDIAGERAILKTLDILKNTKIDVKIILLKGAKDPDEFFNKYGTNAFLENIRKAKTGFRYLLDYWKNIYNYKLPEEKIKCVRKIIPYIMSFEDRLLKNEYLVSLSNELNLEKKELENIVYGKNKKIEQSRLNMPKDLGKNKKIKNLDNAQLTAFKIFISNFKYSDLFTKSILDSFTDEKISKILFFILDLPSNEKRTDIILNKLDKDKELCDFFASISIKSNNIYPEMKKEEFNCYLLAVRKSYLKKETSIIIEKIRLLENERNTVLIGDLRKKYLLYNEEILKITKQSKESNICQN